MAEVKVVDGREDKTIHFDEMDTLVLCVVLSLFGGNKKGCRAVPCRVPYTLMQLKVEVVFFLLSLD